MIDFICSQTDRLAKLVEDMLSLTRLDFTGQKVMLKPLSGIRVVDLSRIIAGPFCTMQLGDMGAEIIKVENPNKGDDLRSIPPFINGESSYFLLNNRNKESITLDLVFLRSKTGRKIAVNFSKS